MVGNRDRRRRRGEERSRRPVLAVALLLVAVMTAVAMVPVVALAEGDGRRVNAEIVGGEPVPEDKYPFMVYVQIKLGRNQFGACGGSVIDATHVLTAAHCATDGIGRKRKPRAFTLFVGNLDRDERVDCTDCRRNVSRVTVHRKWNPRTFENDAAVLTLETPVLKEALPTVNSGDTTFNNDGRGVIVAGWGTTSSDGPVSDVLLETAVKVVGSDRCKKRYGSELVGKVMLCAGEDGRDSCQGDSGGPLFVREMVTGEEEPVERYTQIGIVSWGYGCAWEGYPGVYTKLSTPRINNFIRRAVGEEQVISG